MYEIYEFYRLYAPELVLGTAAVTLLLLLWVIVLQWRLARLRHGYLAAMQGTEGADLEKWLAEQRVWLAEHEERLRGIEGRTGRIEETLTVHAGRVGIVRFNPFQDTGGDQSFSVAWVDEEANGVVISSLFTRNGTRVYAKPLVRGNSSYTLSEEEQQAIQNALGSTPSN